MSMVPFRESLQSSAQPVLTPVIICLKDGSWQDLNRTFNNFSLKFVRLLCRFVYTLFLAVDANFKLKGKDRGINDLELAPGWASFVEEDRYQEHIIQYVDQSEACVIELIASYSFVVKID